MDIKQVVNYMKNMVLQREQRNKEIMKEKARDPIKYQYEYKKNYDFDFRYYDEIITKALETGLLIMPKDEEELAEFEANVYFNFIEGLYEKNIEFKRNSYHQNYLVRYLEKHEKGTLIYPEYRMRCNFEEIVNASPDEFEDLITSGAYCGTKRYMQSRKFNLHDFDMIKLARSEGYSFENCEWIKGKISIKLVIPDSTKLNDRAITKLCEFVQKTQERSRFSIGEIDISFNQKKSGERDTRYRINDGVTMGQVTKLYGALSKMGAKVNFCEFETNFNRPQVKWSFDQLKKANDCIDELARTIEKNNLSPFEAVLFVSAWANKNLKYNDQDVYLELTNTIIAAANRQKVKCVGFTEFINAVLNSVHFSNENGIIDVKKISCTTKKDEFGNILPNHSQSLIYINDKKYNINGGYICDVNAVNFIGNLAEQINKTIAELGAEMPKIQPFNSLCLRNLNEYRMMLPEYTIFPFTETDTNVIQYDRQVSANDIRKYLDAVRKIEGMKPEEVNKYLKENNISFSAKPVKVNDVDYSEFMKESKLVMRALKKEQGKPIPEALFSKAYFKIIKLLYPELVKDEDLYNLTCAGISVLNKTITDFIETSQEENEFTVV